MHNIYSRLPSAEGDSHSKSDVLCRFIGDSMLLVRF